MSCPYGEELTLIRPITSDLSCTAAGLAFDRFCKTHNHASSGNDCEGGNLRRTVLSTYINIQTDIHELVKRKSIVVPTPPTYLTYLTWLETSCSSVIQSAERPACSPT